VERLPAGLCTVGCGPGVGVPPAWPGLW